MVVRILRLRHLRRGNSAAKSHTQRPASASPALHADAPGCTPGGNCPSPAAAPVGWPPPASPYFLLQRAMHPLVPPVLLRMSRFDPLRHNPQLDPPHRQPRQTRQRRRCKRRPVVGPDRFRHSILAKGRFEDRLHPRRVRLLHRLAAQQIPAVRIRDGQRIDPLSIPRAKPAFEIRAPHPVRSIGMRQRLRVWRGLAAASSAPLPTLPASAALRSCSPPATSCPGSSRSSTRFSLRGPQRMCASPQLQHRSSISSGVWFHAVAWLGSAPPALPTPLPDTAATTHTRSPARSRNVWHSSLIVCCRCSYSNTNRSFSSITLLFLHGMRSFYSRLPSFAVSEIPPVCSVRHLPGLYLSYHPPPSHRSSQVWRGFERPCIPGHPKGPRPRAVFAWLGRDWRRVDICTPDWRRVPFVLLPLPPTFHPISPKITQGWGPRHQGSRIARFWQAGMAARAVFACWGGRLS